MSEPSPRGARVIERAEWVLLLLVGTGVLAALGYGLLQLVRQAF